MRVDCRLDPGAVIRPGPGEWHPRMPEQLDENELADWRAGRDAVYQLAARGRRRVKRTLQEKTPAGGAGVFEDRRSSREKGDDRLIGSPDDLFKIAR
jgi:hypothetical protein